MAIIKNNKIYNQLKKIVILRRIKRTLRKRRIKLFDFFGIKKSNKIMDVELKSIKFNEINYKNKKKINVTNKIVQEWLFKGNLGELIYLDGNIHKKGLEFFFSSYLLNIKEEDIILDAAGGSSHYLEAVKLNSLSSHLILTDHIYEGLIEKENGMKIVGGDISAIHLDDSSVTKIACHHAFEHFQENKDQLFIKEAYRILKKGGCLVIIPLFLTDKYSECWNIKSQKHFDKKSNLIFDSTATLPGGDADGHFCRLYSVESLEKRILNLAKDINFDYEIIECEIDHQSIPKSKNNCGSKLNAPTRALKLTKN